MARHQCDKRTQPQLSEIEFPLNISWECGQDMPIMMDYYPDVVILKGQIFIGGGVFGADARAYLVTGLGQYTVMMYNIEKETWGTLPPYDFYWFSLTSLNDQLVLVGGVRRHIPKRTNLLGVWDDRGGTSKWMHTLPPMPTSRSGATVITHNNRWMLVAGGFHEHIGCLSVVEIFDNLTRQWYGSTPLPLKGFKLSSTVIKNTWYLLGGYTTVDAGYRNKQVIYADLNDLIAQAILKSVVASPAQWSSLPDTPLKRSTALALNGALLAVGGESDDLAICLYQPTCKNWTRSEELLCARKDCACAILPSGRLFLLGGDTQQVQIGTFNNSKTKYT